MIDKIVGFFLPTARLWFTVGGVAIIACGLSAAYGYRLGGEHARLADRTEQLEADLAAAKKNAALSVREREDSARRADVLDAERRRLEAILAEPRPEPEPKVIIQTETVPNACPPTPDLCRPSDLDLARDRRLRGERGAKR